VSHDLRSNIDSSLIVNSSVVDSMRLLCDGSWDILRRIVAELCAAVCACCASYGCVVAAAPTFAAVARGRHAAGL